MEIKPRVVYMQSPKGIRFRGHLRFRVKLSLLRGELILEELDLVGRVGENILHFSLVVGVDFFKLELNVTESTAICITTRCTTWARFGQAGV